MGKWEHGHEGREGTGTRVRRALGMRAHWGRHEQGMAGRRKRCRRRFPREVESPPTARSRQALGANDARFRSSNDAAVPRP
jgi:hypothetical protein